MGKKRRGRSSAAKAKDAKNGQNQEENGGPMHQVSPPEPFNFEDPSLWPKWIKRFNTFLSATGMSKDPEDQQVSMLLYCMGEDADDLLNTLGMTEEEKTSLDCVVAMFEEYFTAKKNIYYHRALFLQRNQRPGETKDLYMNSLRKLSKQCNWFCSNCKSKNFNDEMVLLKLITGISDKNLSKELQLRGAITLTNVMKDLELCEPPEEKWHKLDGMIDSYVQECLPPKGQLLDESRKQLYEEHDAQLSYDEQHKSGENNLSMEYDTKSLPTRQTQEDSQCCTVGRKKKTKFKLSFSSGIDTCDEHELSTNRYPHHYTGRQPSWGSSFEDEWPTDNGATSASKDRNLSHAIGPEFLKEKNTLDFPFLPSSSESFEFPSKKHTAKTTSRDEPSTNRYPHHYTGRHPSWGSSFENERPTDNGATSASKDKNLSHAIGPEFSKEKNTLDFPILSSSSESFEFPSKKHTAKTTSKGTRWRNTYLTYDSSDYDTDFDSHDFEYYEALYGGSWLDTSSEESYSEINNGPKIFGDRLSNGGTSFMENSPKIESGPNTVGTYQFSVSGHMPRRALRNMCQKSLKNTGGKYY